MPVDGLVVKQERAGVSVVALIAEQRRFRGLERHDQAQPLPILGDMRDAETPHACRVARMCWRDLCAIHQDAAALGDADAGEHLQQFALPVAAHAGNADDLAGTN